MTDHPTLIAPEADQPEPTAEEIQAAMPYLMGLFYIFRDMDIRLARESEEAAKADADAGKDAA